MDETLALYFHQVIDAVDCVVGAVLGFGPW